MISFQVPCLSDNYAYLLLNTATKAALAVDPSEAASVAAAAESAGARLSAVLCTHHHWDHTGGNLELKKKYGLQVSATCTHTVCSAGQKSVRRHEAL